MSSLPPDFSFDDLPPNTIVPPITQEDIFIPYLNRLYEEIALAVNQRDFIFFTIPITHSAANIPNMENFGAFLICVSGTGPGLPTLTASLSKPDPTIAGNIVVIDSQAGTIAPFSAATLTISSTATNFQIAHSVANTTGNFNIRFIGTQ